MRAWFPLLFGACAAGDDLDLDGFAGEDDCDDADPYVYPGAPDDPGDGIDGDCSGADEPFAFFGGWTLTGFTATQGGVGFIVSDETTGSLTLGEDFSVGVDVEAAIDPAIIGFAISVPFSLRGTASPVFDGADRIVFYADGNVALLDEVVHFDWDCSVEADDSLACTGEIKALDTSLLGDARFVRP